MNAEIDTSRAPFGANEGLFRGVPDCEQQCEVCKTLSLTTEVFGLPFHLIKVNRAAPVNVIHLESPS